MFKYAFGKVRQENDEAAALDQAPIDVETQVEAQEGQEIIKEVIELSDAIESYSETAEKLGDIQQAHEVQVQVMDGDASVVDGSIKNEDDVTINVDAKEVAETAGVDGEILDTKATDAQADEAAAKLESDMSAVLAGIGATLRSSKFSKSGGVLSSRTESDFKLRGKRGYRARVEGISEVGKKVWESIKAFFAKIWDFLKGLFERFTALFKSNKSILLTLKAKLEKEDDSKYHSIKQGAKESQPLTFFHTYGKVYVSNVAEYVNQYVETMNELVNSIKEMKFKEADASVNSIKKTIISKISLNDADLDGLNKLVNFVGVGVNSEGVLGFTIKTEVKNESISFNGSTKTLKIKKASFEKSKSLREDMIEICEYGIDLCDELAGSLIKDAEKNFNSARKEAEDIIKELYDRKSDDPAKNDPKLKEAQKVLSKLLTFTVSSFSKTIATVGNQPSQVVAAVRNAMSMCEAEGK